MQLLGVWRTLIVCVFVLTLPTLGVAQDFDFDAGGDEGGGEEDGGDDGGGSDFNFDDGGEGDGAGDAGTTEEATPMETYTIDESSLTFKSMKEADGLSEAKKHYQASLKYFEVLQATDETAKALTSRATYELGRTLYQLGFYQSALAQFEKIVQIGPQSEFFMPTLQWLVLISRELPGDPAKATRIYDNYLPLFPEQIDDALIPEVGLLMGQAAYQNNMLDDAIFFFGHVPESSDLYPKARFIEGVTFVRQFNGTQAVESFKDILRFVNAQEEPTNEQLRMQELAVASLARVFYQVGSILWDEGERQKAVNSWNTSIKYYSTFTQDSPIWLDSLFEASWTYYRVDQFNRALGLLHTLNSPFFNDEYYPEAMLLQAQIYYTNCHYDRVMYILEEFKEVYPPLKERLEKQTANLLQEEDYYRFLREANSGEFDPGTKQVINAALKDRELRRLLGYIDQLDEEMTALDNAKTGWSGSKLTKSLKQEIEFTKQFAAVSAGSKAKARIERVIDELNELNNKALDIEIETTEKFADMSQQKGMDDAALQQFEQEINEMMSADDEHLFWTFDGEYWRDELGYYWYYITSRCGR